MPLSTSSNLEYTTTNIPAFLSKLWTLVEDPKYDELIAWDQAGFSFHVFDQTRFSREILPRFFKHNNMASFIRQLNMYGFRKVNSIDHGSLKSEKEDMEFHHPYFMRGKEQFLEFIKRKVPDLKMTNQPVNAIPGPTNQNNNQSALQIQYPQIKADELSKVLDDVNSMKSRQKLVDDSIFSMKKENEALWKEIASLRQKHHHQQQIVNKLIHFLVHLVNPSSLGLKRTTRPLMIDSHSAKFTNLDDNENRDEFGGDQISELDDDLVKRTTKAGTNVGGVNVGSDHEDEELILTTNRPRQQIVEIEDYEDNSNKFGGSSVSAAAAAAAAAASNYGEIETINRSKNLNMNAVPQVRNVATKSGLALDEQQLDDIDLQPVAKRLKSTADDNVPSSLTQSIIEMATVDKQSDGSFDSNAIVKEMNSSQQQQSNFLNPNIFLNTSSSSSTTQAAPQQQQQSLSSTAPVAVPIIQQPLSHQSVNSPIVSTPGSPGNTNSLAADSLAVNQVPPSSNMSVQRCGELNLPGSASLEAGYSNNSTATAVTSPHDRTATILSSSSSSNLASGSSGGTCTFSDNNTNDNDSLDNTSKVAITSSNTMNDHVESLQLDLNSIKEFLTQNSFNTIDPYTINNLFSPIILDQIENDVAPFYTEPSSGNEPPIALRPTSTNGTNSDLGASLANVAAAANLVSDSANGASNGKIVGNEVIQHYAPVQLIDYFNIDDLFTARSDGGDSKSTTAPPTPESLGEHFNPATSSTASATTSKEDNDDQHTNGVGLKTPSLTPTNAE